MEERGAPWAVGDAIAWGTKETRVELASTSWSSLYATALILARAIQGNSIADYSKAALLTPASSTTLEGEFQRRAASLVQHFLLFLADWDIAKYLGTWETRHPVDVSCPHPEGEEKLLGLHTFATLARIEKYVLLWKNNPNVVANGIATHRLVAARGIDLVCSELLTNAFEHGGAPRAVFTPECLSRHKTFVTAVASGSTPAYSRLRILIEERCPKGLIGGLVRGDKDALTQLSLALNKLLSDADLFTDEWLGFAARRSREIAAYRSEKADAGLINRLVLEECFPADCPLPRPFVLAKLCRPASSDWALRLNSVRPYLDSHERGMYERAATDRHSILQLVIADLGGGLAKNTALITKLQSEAASLPPEDRNSLIRYALRPEVTTKLHTPAIRREWGSYLRPGIDVNDYTATVHGLSEVRNVVDEADGFWRIHTGDLVADIGEGNSSDSPTPVAYRERHAALELDGCLHYVAVPLISKKTARTRPPQNGASCPTAFIHFPTPLSCRKDSAPEGQAWWEAGVRTTVSELLSVSQNADVAVIALGNLDEVEDNDIGEVCAVLIDAIHRVRQRTGVILAGAGDRVCSHLQRFEAWQKVFLDRYVVACVNAAAGDLEIRLFCGAEVVPIRNALAAILLGRGPEQESINNHEDLLVDVVEHNRGLFEVHGGRVRSRAHIDLSDPRWVRAIHGGWEFSRLAAELQRHHAVVRIDKLKRLGEPLSFYIHLGRLWSDEEFRSEIRCWLSQVLRAIGGHRQSAAAGKTSPRCCIVSLLQPATDMVRLVRVYDPDLKEVEFVDLRRMDMLRWDSPQISRLASTRVICVTDITRTRSTLQRLNNALTALDASLVAVCSVLSVRPDMAEKTVWNEYGFSAATPAEFSGLGSALPKSATSKPCVVDSDTQTISEVKRLSFDAWRSRSQRLTGMLAKGDLVVAHGVFGERHHTLYTRLSRASDDLRFDLVTDIAQNCDKFFDGAPDVVLYPSDSTIVYLLRERRRIGGEQYIPLASQRAGQGAPKLMLEADGEFSGMGRDTSLKVLFLDDSRSSGDTERAALDAYLAQRSRMLRLGGKTGVTDRWLSYVVLNRQGVGDPNKGTTARPIRSGSASLTFAPRHYVQSGVLAMDTRSCPFEDAENALRHALEWLRYARPALRERLKSTHRWVGGSSIEESEECPALSPEVAEWFAFLSDHERPSGLLVATEGTSDANRLAAACLFLAVHGGEAAAYLSDKEFSTPFLHAADIVASDDAELATVLCIAIWLLPPSVTSEFVTDLAVRLWRRDLGETAGCILAAFFGRFDKAVEMARKTATEFDDFNTEEPSDNRRPAAMATLRQKHWQELWSAVQQEGATLPPSGTTAVARCDLLVFRDGAAEHDAVTTARQLGALGVAARLDHLSFLRCRLAQGKVEEVHPLVKTASRCATSLLRLLGLDAPQSQRAREHMLDDLVGDLDTCETEQRRQEVAAEYRKTAIEYCEYIHQEGPLNRHFTMGKVLFNMLCTAVSDTHGALVETGRTDGLINLLIANDVVPQDVCRQMLLLPDATSMQDILANLVRNPFDHLLDDSTSVEPVQAYRLVLDQLARTVDPPFIRTHIHFDGNANSVSLVVMDKGKKVRRPNLFNPRHNLGNARFLLEVFGGRLRYSDLAQDHDGEYAGLDAVRSTIGAHAYRAFVNAFILELPVVWEVSESWQV
jgi:hypothetical protein